MSCFESYFLMKDSDVSDYIRDQMPDYFDADANITVKEIGDGNLNYVFRLVDESRGKSIIVKQAGEVLRISADMKISTDRNRIESEILILQDKYAPGLVPKIYKYDTVMCACIMEDLSDYQLMRYALMEHKTFPDFADDITTFMVNTLLNSTDIVMEHKAKKDLVKSFINPELCGITEDLVYTEPYNDVNKRNLVTKENSVFVKKELYGDAALHLEVAKLKFEFMNNAQALLHGDLHTGSIFVKSSVNGESEAGAAATRVFDPEFAFYGPMGYDIGNVIANLFFAWDNGNAAGDKKFCDWVLKTAAKVIDLFKKKFLVCFKKCATDRMAKTAGFAQWYLETILSDTAACTGLELIRRTVGMAQVKDVTSITDIAARIKAEQTNILCAKEFIIKRAAFKKGEDFVAALLRAAKRTKFAGADKNPSKKTASKKPVSKKSVPKKNTSKKR
ncbi:MAG: S-methyl-5-thioribose kinase [Termitinemataceae bacterium]|nr:MAG: S-methyl-5-thioribose kinase [Termitinemataceae bacterium]